jgi:hypothetical protein
VDSLRINDGNEDSLRINDREVDRISNGSSRNNRDSKQMKDEKAAPRGRGGHVPRGAKMDLGVAALYHPSLGPASALYSLTRLRTPGSSTVTTIKNDGDADTEVNFAAVPSVLHSIIIISHPSPTIPIPLQLYST